LASACASRNKRARFGTAATGADELEGDPAPEIGIQSGDHHPHAASAEGIEHDVAIDDRAASGRAGVRSRRVRPLAGGDLRGRAARPLSTTEGRDQLHALAAPVEVGVGGLAPALVELAADERDDCRFAEMIGAHTRSRAPGGSSGREA